MRWLLLVNLVGAVHAVRRDLPARLWGIRFPGSATLHALTIGSAASAPPAMLAALVLAARRNRTDGVWWLATTFAVGVLGEPDTWRTLRQPGGDPVATACVVGEIALPAALLWRVRHAGPASRRSVAA